MSSTIFLHGERSGANGMAQEKRLDNARMACLATDFDLVHQESRNRVPGPEALGSREPPCQRSAGGLWGG